MLYDGAGERIRVTEEVSENQTRPAEEVLVFFRQRKQFTIDLKTHKCVSSTPKHEFHRIGVPEDYHFAEDVMIGTEGDGVEISVFYKNENSSDVNGLSIAEFTRKDCIPTYNSFDGEANGEKLHYHRDYLDVRLGQVPSDAFNVPKECSTSFTDTLL